MCQHASRYFVVVVVDKNIQSSSKYDRKQVSDCLRPGSGEEERTGVDVERRNRKDHCYGISWLCDEVL